MTPIYGVDLVVQAKEGAHRGGVRAHPPAPERIGDHDHARCVLPVVLIAEYTANRGLRAQGREEAGVANGAVEDLGQSAVGGRKTHTPVAVVAHGREAGRVFAPVIEIEAGDGVERIATDDIALVNADETIGIRIGERCEQDGPNYGEDSGVRADAERQDEHRSQVSPRLRASVRRA
jgi:hypothetical protein